MQVPTTGRSALFARDTPDGAKSHISRMASIQAVWLNMPICITMQLGMDHDLLQWIGGEGGGARGLRVVLGIDSGTQGHSCQII